jgi:hypothetical protein
MDHRSRLRGRRAAACGIRISDSNADWPVSGVHAEVVDEAERIAEAAYLDSLSLPVCPTPRESAKLYCIWEKFPQVRRLLGKGKSITRYHAKDMCRILGMHVFTDPAADMD